MVDAVALRRAEDLGATFHWPDRKPVYDWRGERFGPFENDDTAFHDAICRIETEALEPVEIRTERRVG